MQELEKPGNAKSKKTERRKRHSIENTNIRG
jgi:hypothetical protein